MDPEISIVVPVYNMETMLKRCVRSLQNQTLKEIEIILVDDGSNDSSPKICDQLAKQDLRIRVIHQENQGLLAARKTGVEHASAMWIGFVDADDWASVDMFQNLYGEVKKQNADIVLQGVIEDIDGNERICLNSIPCGVYKTREEKQFLYSHMICYKDYFALGILPYVWNKLFRKDIIEDSLSSVDTRIRVGEDAAIVYPALLDSKIIYVSEECNYHYCIRQNSMMKNLTNENDEFKGVNYLIQYLKKRFEENENRELLLEQLKRYAVNSYLTRSFVKTAKLMPFMRNREIIVYGAGALGSSFFRYLKTQEQFHVKMWVDERAAILKSIEPDVNEWDKINCCVGDAVIIALFDYTLACKIKEKMITMGIDEEQIFWIMECITIDSRIMKDI